MAVMRAWLLGLDDVDLSKRQRPMAVGGGMNKAEKRHHDLCRQVPCLACEQMGYETLPVELHHLRSVAGAGQKASEYEVISLCHAHHRTGGYGVAIHAGQIEWEKQFGSESALLEVQLEKAAEVEARTV